MKNAKKPPAIPPPEIIPLGDGMKAQVTDYSFAIFDNDFNQILRFSLDDGSIYATAGNGSQSFCPGVDLPRFTGMLYLWSRRAAEMARQYNEE